MCRKGKVTILMGSGRSDDARVFRIRRIDVSFLSKTQGIGPAGSAEPGVVYGDGVHLLWQEAIGSIRGRYFIMTRQELDAQTAKDWGAVNEIVAADKLMPRAREIAEELAKLPPLTTKYTRMAMTQKLRRIIDEGVTLGLALEGISAAAVARAK